MQERIAGLIGIALLIGCSQSQPRRLSHNPIATTGGAVLTTVELARMSPSESLFDALKRARPWVLVGRGVTPGVTIDGAVASDISILRSLLVTEVCEVRLVRGTSGAGRSVVLPDGRVSAGGDVIAVETRSSIGKNCEGDRARGSNAALFVRICNSATPP